MNPWLFNVSLVLGANILFVRGIGLELLGLKDKFRFIDIIRFWGWNLLTGLLLTIIRLTLPMDWIWLTPLILPVAALLLWLLVGLLGADENQLIPLIAQTGALGTALILGDITDFSGAILACFTVSLGYLLSLLLLREIYRFFPDDLSPSSRFSLLMLGFTLASMGFGLFQYGTGPQ